MRNVALFDRDFKIRKVGHVHCFRTASNNSHACAHTSECIDTLAHTQTINHSRRTQAFYVRVIKHFACEGIIVGVGPVRAVYTKLMRRGTARDGEGCSLGLGAPGGYRAPFFIL